MLEDFVAQTAALEYDSVVNLDISGLRIQIKSNSAVLAGQLANYFREISCYKCPPVLRVLVSEQEPPKFDFPFKKVAGDDDQPAKQAYYDEGPWRLVNQLDSGLHFIVGEDDYMCVGPASGNLVQVVNFISQIYISYRLRLGGLLMHAAAVAKRGNAAIVCGLPGMGKSTLAMHALGRGCDFVSNNQVILATDDDGMLVYGLPKYPRINPATVLHNPSLAGLMADDDPDELVELPTTKHEELGRQHDVFIDQLFGKGRFKLQSMANALVILNWGFNSTGLQVKQVNLDNRLDLIPAFAQNAGVFFMQPYSTSISFADKYLTLLSRIPVYEVTGGVDFSAATCFIMDLLK